MIDLTALNDKQKEAVEALEGSVLVFAGAGSGKTRVLTMRIANIMDKCLARPYEIMAITFTNKAANEMKERLRNLVDGVDQMWISTIHSMCNRILRYDIGALGFDSSFTIYTETEKDRLIKRIMSEHFIDDKIFKSIKWHIGQAKCENICPQEYARINAYDKHVDEITTVYTNYEEELKKANALDFDDLLIKTYELLAQNEDIRTKYSDKFRYIHIDEFQDTNNIQYKIVKLLYKNHGNLFAVGDDDQSIYAFRGANVKNILAYEKDFPNSRVIKLEQNYRSTKRILEVANAVITKNKTRSDKALWCDNGEGAKVSFNSLYNESNEGQFVAETIKSLVTYNKCNYSDIAVLYRMNSLSRSFENEFVNYNVPYKVFGGLKFFDRKEIKDLTAYLRCIVNPRDTDAFRRIINVPKRGIGDVTVNKIAEYANANGIAFYEALGKVEQTGVLSGATLSKVVAFRDIIWNLMAEAKTIDACEFVKRVILQTNFMSMFEQRTEENISRAENVSGYVASIKEFIEKNEDGTITAFLQSISLMSSLDDIDGGEENCVTLGTIHAVKGLEFKAVFVVGLEDGTFPIIRFDTSEDDLEEERRLMYVAVTRAMERLYLTSSESRYSFATNQRTHMMTSRYITDVASLVGFRKKADDEFLSEIKPNEDFYGGYTGRTSRTEKKPPRSRGEKIAITPTRLQTAKSDEKDYASFKIGAKISHPKFGLGMIVSTSGSGEDIKADIAFNGVGIRTLAVKYAPITLI